MIRSLLFLTLVIVFTIGHTACNHDPGGEETPGSVVTVLSDEEKAELAAKLISPEYLSQRPLGKRSEATAEYLLTYIELKEKKPEKAIEALRTAFHIFAKRKEHPLLEEWLTLVPRVLGVEAGLLTDLYRLNEIELQIARENKEDRKYIQALEKQEAELKAAIEALRAQGVDPAEFKVAFFGPDEEE